MTPLVLVVDTRNPGEYLAVCGLIELLARFDASATAAWIRRAGLVDAVPRALTDACEIRTTQSEAAFARRLAEVLGNIDAWRAVTDHGRVPLKDAIGTWCAGVELDWAPDGSSDTVIIDHWYERAFVDGDRIVQKLKLQDGKGKWKFWAGRLDGQGIAALILDLVTSTAEMSNVTRVQALLTYCSPGASRFNIDSATKRSALERGISANDAADQGRSIRRPALELLAAIGTSSFFPPRRYGEAAPHGTVGIEKRRFRYCTWAPDAPLSLARLLARGAQLEGFRASAREAPIGMMGQYAYLRYARPTGFTPGDLRDNVINEVDDEA